MKTVTVRKKHFQIRIGCFNLFICPKCGGNDVKENYKYCPHCGQKIIFHESLEDYNPYEQEEEQEKEFDEQ